MGRGVNVPTINANFMAMRPSGYLTPEDQQFLDRQMLAGTENIGAGTAQQQGLAMNRLAQRRVGGAAAEQIQSDIGAQGLLARARLARGVADIGHQIYSQNKQFEQGKVMTAWGNEINAHTRYDQRRMAQQAAWANAVSGLARGVAGIYKPQGPLVGGGGAGGGYGGVTDYTGLGGGGNMVNEAIPAIIP